MASRILLSIEPDEAAVAEIKAAFSPYGFTVENIASGEQAIEWARQNQPEAILVCVEPKKVGYAICNKIKRSPELAKIPLVLTSSEETVQTFDQHKKLKSRADEYIIKPLRGDELLAKVGSLVALGDPAEPGSTEEIEFSTDLEEISVSDSDIVGMATPEPLEAALDVGAMEDETDAAFAALQVPHTGPLALPPPAYVPDLSPPADENWEEEHTRAAPSLPFFDSDAPPEASLSSSADQLASFEAALFPSAPQPAFDLRPVVVAESSAAPSFADISVDHTPPPAGVSAVDTARFQELEETVAELEIRLRDVQGERARLQDELEEARQKAQSQPLSREKEALSLREVINRKEKDMLDLRDALDAKDRQILDHKDRIRENERGRRDIEEKMLGLERAAVGAQERMAVLAQDKEKSNERERGLKQRLDDALTEIQKAHEEVDSFKKRLQAAEEKARADLERLRGELQSRIMELQENHRDEVARLADEKVNAEESLNSEYESELARLRTTQAAELEGLQKKSSEELRGLDERLSGELARTRKEGEKALAAAKEEQSVQLSAERQAHQSSVEAKESNHKTELQNLRRQKEEELRAAEERRQRELAEAEEKRVADLEGAETKRRQELAARDEEHHAQQAELDRKHFDEKTKLSESHRQDLDQAHARGARAEGELAARTEELSEAHRRLGGLAADLDSVRADLREREVKLAQSRDRVSELETKVADYEEQILRAFNKLRSDDKTIDRAKRALAVALALLDDRGAAPAAAATPVAKPAGDESAS